MAGIENTAAQNFAKAGRGGNISPLVTGLLTGRYLRGRTGASGSASGGSGKTAADWHNEEISKRYEFDRQGTRRGWMREDINLPNIKNVAYDERGGVSFGAYQVPLTKPDEPKHQTPSGTSGNTRGKQFIGATIPTRPGERPVSTNRGAGGRWTSNPAYPAWKAANTRFEQGLGSQVRTQAHLPESVDVTPLTFTSGAKKGKGRGSKTPKA